MQVPEIDIEQLMKLRADGVPLIDVRQPDEYEAGHVPGAVLIPLGEVTERVHEVPAAEAVYVICRSGARSAKAVEFYRSQGIEATNVAGGTLAWLEAGQPVASGSAPG